MAFLSNDAVNRVNLHTGVQALAQGAGGVFFLVFLLRAGVSVPVELLAQAAIVAGRFLIRPAVLPLAKRWGLKPLLAGGALGVALEYPLLAQVGGLDGWLLALCCVAAVAETFYYLAYNAYFSAIGDAEGRGRQIGAREALVAAASVVAPLLGAASLVALGPDWTFAAVGLVQAASALPLLGAPNVAVATSAPGALRAARPAAILLLIDGWFDAGYVFVWQLALFVSLRESIPAYGGAMALAGLAGAACGLVLGRHVDAGHGRRTAAIAYSAAAAIMIARASSLGSPWLAVGANAAGALLMPLLLPALGTATYNLAKASPCPLRFHVATEGGWDVGCFIACLVSAGLIAWGAPLSVPLLMTLPAVVLGAVMLRRQFPRSGR
jgi:hypothetical protein